jgi:starvation-inducible DNA-binding protein
MTESPEKPEKPRPGIRFTPVSGLSGADRRMAAEALLPVLGDLHMLWLKAHAVHWNAAGPLFRALHTQTEELYRGAGSQFDLVAERLRALGLRVPASLEAMHELASIPDDEDEPETTTAMVEQLLRDIGIFCQTLREAADEVDDADDEASEALLGEILAFHEKQGWMLQMLIAEDGPGSIPDMEDEDEADEDDEEPGDDEDPEDDEEEDDEPEDEEPEDEEEADEDAAGEDANATQDDGEDADTDAITLALARPAA